MTIAEHERAADMIVAQLEAQIASGELADQMPLPAERELMTRFNTSRTVVREAISTLSNRGLIESKPRFRPIVRKPDYETVLSATGDVVRHLLTEPNGVKNLFMSRVFVERGLVREAAKTATKENIRDLKEALAANEKAIDDSQEFFRTDIAFHALFYQIPNNPIFPALHEGYASWLAPHWTQMQRMPERNTLNYRAHKAIFDAILERDPDGAEAALEHHLTLAWEHVSVTFDLSDD